MCCSVIYTWIHSYLVDSSPISDEENNSEEAQPFVDLEKQVVNHVEEDTLRQRIKNVTYCESDYESDEWTYVADE